MDMILVYISFKLNLNKSADNKGACLVIFA